MDSSSRPAHEKLSRPEPESSTFSVCLSLFLVVLSLIISLVVISETVLSFPRIFVLFVAPNASRRQLELAAQALETIEWHTRVQAAALAFGAWVFAWYGVFIAVLRSVFKQWTLFRSKGSQNDSSDLEGLQRLNDLKPLRQARYPFLQACYVVFLLAIIIVNDSLYNRLREPSSTSTRTSCISISEFLERALPGVISRFTTMASRSFEVAAIEVSAMLLVYSMIPLYYRFFSSTRPPLHSNSDLDSEKAPIPAHHVSNLTHVASLDGVSRYTSVCIYFQRPSSSPTRAPGVLEAQSHQDEKISLVLAEECMCPTCTSGCNSEVPSC
ncbi:hypothetical protein BDP27DRAFT_1347461 [Rhodocollybia butyracea]|uniref:Uncharacterized protein n=1 Tax=Rhodocollybia butyracea TaxID=206335 RepID=A0A9P5P1Z9_9AGAR|nr:hypothetical protein BDP27DRAFT_1347461 [Rhodocollybia butyracea]